MEKESNRGRQARQREVIFTPCHGGIKELSGAPPEFEEPHWPTLAGIGCIHVVAYADELCLVQKASCCR